MLGTSCYMYLSLVLSKPAKRLWVLDIPRWCWCITCWSSFSSKKMSFYVSCGFVNVFFWSSPTPDLLITRWVLKIADFGLGDLLDDPPEQHLLYQAPELLRCADIFSFSPKSFPPQTCGTGCFGWKSKRRRVQLRNYSLRNSRQVLNIIYPWKKHPSHV